MVAPFVKVPLLFQRALTAMPEDLNGPDLGRGVC